VELPSGIHAKAQEVAHAYGLSLAAWLRSLLYEHVGYEARLKPGEDGAPGFGGEAEAQAVGHRDGDARRASWRRHRRICIQALPCDRVPAKQTVSAKSWNRRR